ncbi:hypothetical protein [Streptosporangium carneum]|uniref:Uncharacterized protein n=1 Tax=Streptosporangium carneum TaxID=47481 RepID=A0A9W6MAX9_9ACTN|nr:hypothetical protein [Streptosporangium carneum]GLK07779.1 hypothetical protein GCM10017600_11840 [Streptosporangium carneum]
MTVRIDDLDGSLELPEDALETVVGGREPMTPPTPKLSSSLGNGTRGDPLPDTFT